MHRPLLKAAIDLYSRRWGAQQFNVDNGIVKGGIPTQLFNTQSSKREADTVMLFLPGFASLPNKVAPGVLLQSAQENGWDFARFYHPDMILNPSRLTYPGMIREAAQVVMALPHRHIVTVGSSFGAGLMPHVADMVNEEQTGRVTGMFGWSSVTPQGLLSLFERQDAAQLERFKTGELETLQVVTPSLPKPFAMSRQQYDSVVASAQEGPFQSVKCPSLWLFGTQDTLAMPAMNTMWGKMPAAEVVVETMDEGHRIPQKHIQRSINNLANMMR